MIISQLNSHFLRLLNNIVSIGKKVKKVIYIRYKVLFLSSNDIDSNKFINIRMAFYFESLIYFNKYAGYIISLVISTYINDGDI